MNSLEREAAYLQAVLLLQSADVQTSPGARQQTLRQALDLTGQLLELEPENAEYHYLLGRCRYHRAAKDARSALQAEQAFRTALRLEPGHQLARLYLGYLCFDQERYADALRELQHLDDAYFDRIGQHWRRLKTAELILCCRLYLGRDEVDPGDVEELAARYVEADEADVPVPADLTRCVLSEIATAPPDPHTRRIARATARLIERLGFSEHSNGQLEKLYGHAQSAV